MIATQKFLDKLHKVNAERCVGAFHQIKEWDKLWRGCTVGEIGEACNVMKKMARIKHGDQMPPELLQGLADELSDVVTYLDLEETNAGRGPLQASDFNNYLIGQKFKTVFAQVEQAYADFTHALSFAKNVDGVWALAVAPAVGRCAALFLPPRPNLIDVIVAEKFNVVSDRVKSPIKL